MLRSLRARLLLVTISVAGASLAASLLVSRVAVRREFRKLESSVPKGSLRAAAERLSRNVVQGGPAAASDSALTSLAAGLGQELVLIDATGRVLAASLPELRRVRLRRQPGGVVSLHAEVRRAGVSQSREAVLVGPSPAVVRSASGEILGNLYPFPREDAGERREAFLLRVNRWFVFAALTAGLFAVLLAVALSRRILGPIESLTAAARRLAAGDLSHRVGARSGDEIGELSRSFNAMADAIERNEALRRALVSDVAHELRTPLTNLRCQIEALQDGLTEPGESTLHSLHEEVLLLGRLVEDLQDLSLAEAGKLPVHREAISVEAAIESALAAMEPGARARGVRLRADPRGAVGRVNADPARLGQVLRNLLANAIAHSLPDTEVVVSAARDGRAVRFSVRDRGEGIAPEHLRRVFDRFYRIDPSRSRATGGTGLGLAIVKQLVEIHGGSVEIESAVGEGTRVSFTLPAAPS